MKHKVGDSVIKNNGSDTTVYTILEIDGPYIMLDNGHVVMGEDTLENAYGAHNTLQAKATTLKEQLFKPLSEKELNYRKDVVTALRACRRIQWRRKDDQTATPASAPTWRDLEDGEALDWRTYDYQIIPTTHPTPATKEELEIIDNMVIIKSNGTYISIHKDSIPFLALETFQTYDKETKSWK